MNNKLIDLNNHLFAEMERLGDEEITGEALTKEIERARAITGVAAQIIANGSLALKAEDLRSNAMSADFRIPQFMEGQRCTDTQEKKRTSLSYLHSDTATQK